MTDTFMGSEVRYEVTVWNTTNGDIEKKHWDATWEEYQELVEWYRDEPWFDVVVEEKP